VKFDLLKSLPMLFITMGVTFGWAPRARSEGSMVRTCIHPDKPALNFGQAQTGCDAEYFGDIARIKYIYPDFVFDRRKADIDSERKEYVTNMHAIIKRVATEFYKGRFPDATQLKIDEWVHAILAIANNESFLSHYRIGPDGRFKLMTGDHVKSHGIMQNNQDFASNRTLDSSFDLVGNIVTGMDMFFAQWLRAKESDCFIRLVKKGASEPALAQARFQGAYAGYNGGGGAVCRWTNHKSYYHANDDRFLQFYKLERWKKYVIEPNRKVKINTQCLVEGDDLCAVAETYRNQFLEHHPLVIDNGLTCLTNDGKNLDCAKDLRTFACLSDYDLSHVNARPIRMRKMRPDMVITMKGDRDALCSAKVHGLSLVGEFIKVLKRENARPSPGAGTARAAIGFVTPGEMFQIIDYDVILGKKGERFYKVQLPNRKQGWISGGTDADETAWTVQVKAEVAKSAIVRQRADADRAEALRIAALKAAEAKAAAVKLAKAKVAAEKAAAKAAAKLAAKGGKDATPGSVNASAPAVVPSIDSILKSAPAKVVAPEESKVTAVTIPTKGSVVRIIRAAGENLHATSSVDGKLVVTVPDGTKLTVQKVVKVGSNNQIFLETTYNGQKGFLYVGHTFPQSSISDWVKVTN
jgi:hypothetical protein